MSLSITKVCWNVPALGGEECVNIANGIRIEAVDFTVHGNYSNPCGQIDVTVMTMRVSMSIAQMQGTTWSATFTNIDVFEGATIQARCTSTGDQTPVYTVNIWPTLAQPKNP